ncbi:tripartite ATP-independent transporter DctP family solute receptor [Bradyrhizobium sp. USDA 4449]
MSWSRRGAMLAFTVGIWGIPALARAQVELKLGHVLTADSHYHAAAVAFADALKVKTGGKVVVKIFPQGQLGGEVQEVQALRLGTQDVLVTSQAAVVNTIKEWQIFDVPYLFDTVDQANKGLRSETGRKLLDLVDRQGMVGLSWLSVLERDVVSAKKPVTKLADLDGFKIRVIQSPGFVKAYKALGANPVPLPYGQLYLALQQGVVDGAETSPELMIQDKFAEVSKHFVLSHVNHMPVALLMSKATFAKFDAETQAAIRDAAFEASAVHESSYRKQYSEALSELTKRGLEVSAPADLKDWQAATEAARREIVADTPDGAAWLAGLQGVKK